MHASSSISGSTPTGRTSTPRCSGGGGGGAGDRGGAVRSSRACTSACWGVPGRPGRGNRRPAWPRPGHRVTLGSAPDRECVRTGRRRAARAVGRPGGRPRARHQPRRRRRRPRGARHRLGRRGRDRPGPRRPARRQDRHLHGQRPREAWAASSCPCPRPPAPSPPRCRPWRPRRRGHRLPPRAGRRARRLSQTITGDVIVVGDDDGRTPSWSSSPRSRTCAPSTAARSRTRSASRRSRRSCSRSTSATRARARSGSGVGPRGHDESAMTDRLYDTAERGIVPFEPGARRPHVRVRHHAVRLHPPRPRRHVPHLRPAPAPARGPRPRDAHGAQRHRRRRRHPAQGPRARRALPRPGRREIARFDADMDALDMRPPIAEPRATSAIRDILALIGAVLDSGHAYSAGGAVYFDVSTFPDFGQLSHYPDDRDAAAGARAGRQPRRPAQARPARLRAVAAVARPTSPRGSRRWAPAGPAGTSSARRWRCASSGRPSTCTAAAPT